MMISAGVKSNLKQLEKKRSSGYILQIIIRSTFKTSNTMSYSRKKQTARGGHTFVKTPWNFSFFYLTPGNSRQIKAPPLEIVQNCVISPL